MQSSSAKLVVFTQNQDLQNQAKLYPQLSCYAGIKLSDGANLIVMALWQSQ